MAESERVRRAPAPERGARQPKNVADYWVAALRKQSREESNNPNPEDRKQRPPRTQPAVPVQRPLSSNPSLFSLESNLISPATTNSQPFSYSQAPPPPPPQRHSAHEHRNEGRTHDHRQSNHPEQRQNHSNPKSHNSLPNPSPSRHREQLDKVYGEPRYDAEFDRALPTTSRTPTSSSAPPRTLFGVPNGNASSSTLDPPRHRDKDDTYSRRPRSKRDQIDVGDLGGKRGNNSRESIESEDSGRPGSRSSKEARHRRKKEGEKDRIPGEATATSPTTLMSPPASTAPPRQLFDPRRDDPVKFSKPASRKNPTPSVASVASSNNSNAAHPNSDLSSRPELESDGRQDPNPAVTQLRRAYREITELETKLQDEHKAAFVVATREEEAAQGLRPAGVEKKYDDDYWVNLATGHKQLADAHYSFLQIALDPRLPASLHSLPQKYNIPTRLWQTAFHQLLERMRHAITTPSSNPSPGNADPTNVLEHLIEFIQYAYGHYSQLFEDPSVAVFRSAWIEQLGDLARYRMAVAGLASRVSAAQSRSTNTGATLLEPQYEREARPVDAASIGDAALGDWEVEEQESWRVMARDWYSQGIAESPGSGRLQHHLALLSKGDELRGLYHYSKSLCAAHPYLSARESILPLFDDELQARRTQPDVTKAELFVHLHGMLFTKIALDDFDECSERFLERLTEEALLSKRGGGGALENGAAAPFGDAEWFMIAVINIASMLQYGADDGVLKKSMSKETTDPPTKHEGRGSHPVSAPKSKAPSAIMLNPSSLKRETLSEESEDGQATTKRSDDVVKQLNGAASKQEDPPVFRYAQRLSFSILDLLLQHPYRHVGNSTILNPYIVLLLTFLSHLAQQPSTLRSLERAVPWSRLAAFYNTIPPSIEINIDVSTKLLGSPLPEDWCIRGMDWIGRNLFSRGHWRSKQASSPSSKRDQMPPIGPVTSSLESEMDALRLDLSTIDEFIDEGTNSNDIPSAQLALGRWQRIATTAAWIARSAPGFDYDISRGNATRFAILGNLEAKIRRWKREDEEVTEAERQSMLSARDRGAVEIEEEEELSDEEEDQDDVNDSAVVRELKSRRRQLKAVIRQARQATRAPRSPSKPSTKSKKLKSGRSTAKVFAGYTVLVFDTNVLLASMKLFQKLIELETWTIVVPLAVITELDGLRRNDSALGNAAEIAVIFLESAISRYSRYLKVQTSRGNYLKDLTIRSENIDFAGELDSPGALSHDSARNMDDVILKAVGWQKDHFTNRLALVNPGIDRKSVPADAAKVILVTADGNLRLKARARGLDAVDEKGIVAMLEKENG